MKALVKFMDKILGLTGRLGVQEANESDSQTNPEFSLFARPSLPLCVF